MTESYMDISEHASLVVPCRKVPRPSEHIEDQGTASRKTLCGRGYIAALIGVPIGVLGLSIAIPGVVLTARGARGLGAPPRESAPPVPRVSVGPGSAVVTVPF